MSLEFKVLNLDRETYSKTWETQKELFEKRMNNEIGDSLVLVEHEPTISFGMNKEWNKLHVPVESLSDLGIEFVKSERGGGAAYLGPGQLVGYAIMDIKPYGGVLPFMKSLEEVMIRTAKDFGVSVGRYNTMNPTTDKPYRATWYTKNGSPSVLCTKGIKVQLSGKGTYTHHGFALNVNSIAPSYFHLIDPCGFPVDKVKPISMGEILGRELDLNEVKASVVNNFREVFYKNPRKIKQEAIAV